MHPNTAVRNHTMRNFKTGLLGTLLAVALAACGGGGAENDAFRPGQPTTPTTAVAQTLTITTSAPVIPSDGSAPADITVYARNANNQFVSGVPVTISSSSGGLNVTAAVTGQAGTATATLSPAGDPTPRNITVTATAGTATASIVVAVGGTALTLSGPASLTLQQTGTYTVSLADSSNRAVANTPVTITSAKSNTLTPATLTTDSQGRGTFTVTAVNGGNDTITATALGIKTSQAVAVNADQFVFTAPAANTEVALGATQTVTVNWKVAGVAQVNQPVSFSTTRGTVTPLSPTTDGAGNITAQIQATNAGGGVITASGGSSQATLPVEFVATTPASIDVQPSAFSIATGQSSTLTAVVRDAAGNLVKNKTVVFTLVDVTGGTLSVGSAVTDSQGRAQTVYTASNTASANQGVLITATVQGTAIAKQVALTVARREVFISLGTGNSITEVASNTQYQVDYAVQVTDANGAGVPNVPLSVRVLSVRYYKGYRALLANNCLGATTTGTGWGTCYTLTGSYSPSLAASCPDEDVNHNGQLDPGEDSNNSGRIEAGNIVAVSPGTATTDASGLAVVHLTYPQEFAYYLDVQLSANATVQGTEYVRSSTFMLQGSADDFGGTISPPGPVSPFGTSITSCSDKN